MNVRRDRGSRRRRVCRLAAAAALAGLGCGPREPARDAQARIRIERQPLWREAGELARAPELDLWPFEVDAGALRTPGPVRDIYVEALEPSPPDPDASPREPVPFPFLLIRPTGMHWDHADLAGLIVAPPCRDDERRGAALLAARGVLVCLPQDEMAPERALDLVRYLLRRFALPRERIGFIGPRAAIESLASRPASAVDYTPGFFVYHAAHGEAPPLTARWRQPLAAGVDVDAADPAGSERALSRWREAAAAVLPVAAEPAQDRLKQRWIACVGLVDQMRSSR